MQSGIESEIYRSIRDIARVTPDLRVEDREGMCGAIITLCDLGEQLMQYKETNKKES
ncbi:hypothetical protein [Aeromonas dhakensis]|uniref:hypothetical protein n=1 Tax=Aeromonas dhakensis TaxID=196024 RepID=UPI00197FB3EC|nr:hypothetical protein [Aeromonas dhakensis]MBW3733380.1 hypothetical protein [Aeromonas dhakensis]QSR54553.1 hypothetical protein GO601_03365 [Aeromonas dhakensis]